MYKLPAEGGAPQGDSLRVSAGVVVRDNPVEEAELRYVGEHGRRCRGRLKRFSTNSFRREGKELAGTS
jgi:hypothetical protein